MRRAERKKPGLVLLQVDAGGGCDALRGQCVGGTEGGKGGFQLLDRKSVV